MPSEKSRIEINGTSYPISDANAVKFDRQMALTDAQKQQTRANIGLGNVNNTSDADKPVSTAQAAALALKSDKADTPVKSDMAIIVNGDTAGIAVPVDGYAYIKNNTHGLADGLYINTSSSAFPVSGGIANSAVFSAVGGLGALNLLAVTKIRYGSVDMSQMSDITIAGSAGRYKDITFDGFTSPPCVLATFRNDNISTYGNLTIAVSSVTKTSARLLVPYPLNESNAGVYWMAIGQ